MKILVLGAYDSGNLGDPIICECVASWLHGHFPRAEVVIRDVLVRKDAGEPDLKRIRRSWQRNRLLSIIAPNAAYGQYSRWVDRDQAYFEEIGSHPWDAVVFAGGQMFMDRYALFLEAHVRHFQERNIPVFFNACGTGPAYSPKIARQLKQTLESPCVRYISCRDDAALINRRYAPCMETFDPALTVAAAYGVGRAENADTIGLGVIFNVAVPEKKQTRFWQKLVRELERRGEKWQFFTNGDPADMTYAREILASMPEFRGREDALLHPRDTKPEDLVRTIAGYRSILSFRLHSHILAASLDVPSVAMVWDGKLPFFFGKIGHPERCFRVDSDPLAVLEGLARAEREGLDRALLESQASFAEEQLVRAMTEALPGLAEDCL